jgi:sedoheptulose-bisphosphatase
LVGCSGRDVKVAAMAVYGPRTSITLAIDGIDYAHEFILVDDFSARHGEWIKIDEFTTVNEGEIFSTGNLKAMADNSGYQELFTYWNANDYKLSYTGGMVSDVNQIVVKGRGIFVNPDSPSSKSKLKLIYEAVPLSFLVEKAGGLSSGGDGSILDIKVEDLEQESQIALGSREEVERFEKMIGKKFQS